jgi:hypothetical protein
MRPPLLKSKLCAKIYKTEGFLSQREFLHADKVIVVFYLVFDFLFRFVDSIDKWGYVVNYLKLPVGRKIMGCFKNPFFKPGVIAVKKIFSEIFCEIAPKTFDIFIYLLEHQGIDFLPFFAHQLVKNRGLDVGQYDAGEKFKNPAFYQFDPVDLGVAFGFFELSEHVGYNHFMRLFVQFGELNRANVIVPPLDAGRFINPVK